MAKTPKKRKDAFAERWQMNPLQAAKARKRSRANTKGDNGYIKRKRNAAGKMRFL